MEQNRTESWGHAPCPRGGRAEPEAWEASSEQRIMQQKEPSCGQGKSFNISIGGFFALDQPVWSGFLAGWPRLPGNEHHESWPRRLLFGLQLLVRIPLPVQLKLAAAIASFSLEGARSFRPRFIRRRWWFVPRLGVWLIEGTRS